MVYFSYSNTNFKHPEHSLLLAVKKLFILLLRDAEDGTKLWYTSVIQIAISNIQNILYCCAVKKSFILLLRNAED
jgi:hypothetical protein